MDLRKRWRERQRRKALGKYITAWEREYGELTDAEREEADRIFEDAAKLRS